MALVLKIVLHLVHSLHHPARARELFIVRIHFIIVMIRWTGLAAEREEEWRWS